ncbi:hypothetical protein G6F68_018306 [Rhizopus microsporus]|nr:hypothetical protein G6F68_018306 [Rhizopus microsporus]
MHTHPAYRAGQPRVCRAHTIPATASSSHGHGAAATAKLAQPALPTHATGTIVSASGVTTNVTEGIATALASGDPTDT